MFPLFVAVLFSFVGVITAQSSDLCPPEKLTFSEWEDWQQITRKPVKSAAQGNNWVGIFVNELALSVYLNAGPLYPECAAIVKPIYADPDGQLVKKLTIMAKMPAGFDDQNGNWWYASSEPSGTRVIPKVQRSECIACHEQAVDTDYLFSEDVLEAIKE
jgi:cytochrome P460